jgi:hypothetical protein
MKKQNDPNKTNYYTPYKESKPSHERRQEYIDSIPDRCWWLKQYMRGLYMARK